MHGFIGQKLEVLILLLNEIDPESGEGPAKEVMNEVMEMVENKTENYQ